MNDAEIKTGLLMARVEDARSAFEQACKDAEPYEDKARDAGSEYRQAVEELRTHIEKFINGKRECA